MTDFERDGVLLELSVVEARCFSKGKGNGIALVFGGQHHDGLVEGARQAFAVFRKQRVAAP